MKSLDVVRRSGGSFGAVFSTRGAAACGIVGFVAIAACSSKSSGSGGAGAQICQTPPAEIADAAALVEAGAVCAAGTTGVTLGPEDMHCEGTDGGEMRQVTEASACCATTDAAGDDGGGSEVCNAAGVVASGPDDGTCCSNAYNPTMWGQQGSDDDCKYDVSWTATPVCLGSPVYFTVHANLRVNATTFGSGLPLTGAGPYIEAVLNCSVPASAQQPPPVEFEPGVYQVGPIVFPQPGVWSVRFHFNENCYDELPDSPHGHAAFWVTVPEADGGVPTVDGASSEAPDSSSDAASSSSPSDATSDAVEQ